MTDDVTYIKKSIDKYVTDAEGTAKFIKEVFIDNFGPSITDQQKIAAMSKVISNSFDAFRKAGEFPNLGPDPDILTLFTPAGSIQLTRLNFNDPVLNQYKLGANSFSIVSLGNAIGNISSTFNTGDPSLFPTNLVQVIGNIALINLDGNGPATQVFSIADKIGTSQITTDPTATITSVIGNTGEIALNGVNPPQSLSAAIGSSQITINSTATITSVIGNTSDINLDGITPPQSLSEAIGQNVSLNANIPNKTNLVTAINDAFTHTKARPVFLTSFCSVHEIPTTTTSLANVMIAAMRVILNNSVTIGDADDLTDCILGAAVISSGTSTALTVTVNACPGFDSGAQTCQPINPATTYTSKQDCITGTQNYFSSLALNNANIFTNAITNPFISDALAGEVCAQYDN
jgi:hypothetical protein